MNLHFSFKSAKSSEIEKEIQQHVQKLDRYLHVFRPELVHLHGTIDRGRRDGFTAALNLRLPTGQLFSNDEGDTPSAAVKVAFSELLGQLKRHKELLRSEHKWKRVRKGSIEPVARAEAAVERLMGSREARETSGDAASPAPKTKRDNGAAAPEEITTATFAAENRNLFQADIRHYIDANLARLERYIARELRFRESVGDIEPGQVTENEVVDEVVLAALSMEERPRNVSLERWLYRLAIEAVRQLSRPQEEDSALHLEQTVREPNVSGSDEVLLQYHQPGETLNREDVIPDSAAGNPEELAANDEFIAQLDLALRGTRREDRETFLLYAIEGFTVREIGQVFGRELSAVRSSIAAARNHLVKKLPPSNAFKKKLLQHSIVA
jgi:RNA polymerase sigma factor (sigma-70 family)